MPLKKRGGKPAVSFNIHELLAANKQKPVGKRRPIKQIQAIALSSVYGKRSKHRGK